MYEDVIGEIGWSGVGNVGCDNEIGVIFSMFCSF